jgi:hypothetical protein
MDRAVQLVHLAEAERHVAAGRRLIARQEAIIVASEQQGDDATLAKALLATFVESLDLHQRHLLQIRDDLLRGD